MIFHEQFHYDAVCVVERETTTFDFSMQEKQSANDFEVSENNIKILDILFSEKLQITYMFRWKTLCKLHALDY